MNDEVARYERDLAAFDRADRDRAFDIADVRGVDYCGTVGIVGCDRSLDFFGCQRALRLEQDVMRWRLLTHLPMPLPVPEAIQAQARPADGQPDAVKWPTVAQAWAQGFYPQAWALARGSSAGPDCAGDIPVRQVWCDAREANRRLADAVLAWQVARFLGTAEPAQVTGWAQVPPPTRPVARQDRGTP